MRWSFTKGNLAWYEYTWAALPIGITAIGGAIGGGCGGLAVWWNLRVMQGARPRWQKYSLTGGSSLAALAAYLILARVFLSVTGLGAPTAASVDRQLVKRPMYLALRQNDPAIYARIRDTIVDGAAHHRTQAETNAAVQTLLGGAVHKSLPFAADAAVLDITRVMTLEIDQIGARNADACADFLLPRPGRPPVAVGNFVTAEVLADDNKATAAVIETAAAHPRTVPQRAEVAPALNQVVRALTAQFGAAQVQGLAKPDSISHAQYCTLTSVMFKQILTLPAPQAASVLRFLMSLGAV